MARPSVTPVAASPARSKQSRSPATLPAFPPASSLSGKPRSGADVHATFARVPGWSEFFGGPADRVYRPQQPQHASTRGNAVSHLPELPRAELPTCSDTPTDAEAAIFDIEVEDSCTGSTKAAPPLDRAAELQYQSPIMAVLSTARTQYDCALRSDATELSCTIGDDLTHAEKVTALAERLRARGYAVSVRTSVGSYAPSTLEFNLRHTFLSCQPPAEAEDTQIRIVDPSFKEQFDIANPSPGYRAVLKAVPVVFVGSVSTLQSTIEKLSSSISESFRLQAMPIPPWRRAGAFYSKWFPSGPYHAHPRTVLGQSSQ